MMLNLTPAIAATFIAMAVKLEELAPVLVTTAIFTAFGLIVFGLAYVIILKATPFSIRKELEEDQNVALAVVIGAVIIGISLIISAAIQG
jgi:putative membrane protein